jgi:hypothetical protein
MVTQRGDPDDLGRNYFPFLAASFGIFSERLRRFGSLATPRGSSPLSAMYPARSWSSSEGVHAAHGGDLASAQ